MHNRLGAVFGGDEDGTVGVMEHPEPQLPLPTLIRFRPRPTRARQEPRLDQARLHGKRLSAGVEDVDQRAFANVQAEQVAQHVAQSRQRNAWTERR